VYLRIALVILAVAAAAAVGLAKADTEVLQIVVNATGKYYLIPVWKFYMNFSYLNYRFYVYWKGDCLYVSATTRTGDPADVHITLYGARDLTSSLEHIADFDVHGTYEYCNETLSNYTYLVYYVYFPSGGYVGPVGLFRANLFNTPTLSTYIVQYVPFILAAMFCALTLSYHMRRMFAGLICAAGLSFLLAHLLPSLSPVFDNQLVRVVIPAVMIFLALVVGYVLEKHPEV